MSAYVTVDTRALERRIFVLRRSEVPGVIRNTINDTMRDVVNALRVETRKAFPTVTPYIERSARIKERATKGRLLGVVHMASGAYALSPHTPGFAQDRAIKRIEMAARANGLMGAGEWLVPSRTASLDRYGNFSKRTLDQMERDIASGGGKGAYIWGEVKGRKGSVRGVWNYSRFRRKVGRALELLAVSDEPSYRKRFDFYGVARKTARSVSAAHGARAVEQIIKRRSG